MDAAKIGNAEIVELLLEFKANPNLVSKEGYNALMHASKRGYQKVVASLIKARSDLDQRLGSGRNAMLLAIENGHVGVAWRL